MQECCAKASKPCTHAHIHSIPSIRNLNRAAACWQVNRAYSTYTSMILAGNLFSYFHCFIADINKFTYTYTIKGILSRLRFPRELAVKLAVKVNAGV